MPKSIKEMMVGSSHYRKLADVPIIGDKDTLATVCAKMDDAKVSFVLYQIAPQHYRFVGADTLIAALRQKLDLATKVVDIIRSADAATKATALVKGIAAPFLPVFSIMDTARVLNRIFAGPSADIPAIVLDAGEPAGVWTFREVRAEALFKSPPIYYCGNPKKKHPNPPPKDGRRCQQSGCGYAI
jgi:hypothetical protein